MKPVNLIWNCSHYKLEWLVVWITRIYVGFLDRWIFIFNASSVIAIFIETYVVLPYYETSGVILDILGCLGLRYIFPTLRSWICPISPVQATGYSYLYYKSMHTKIITHNCYILTDIQTNQCLVGNQTSQSNLLIWQNGVKICDVTVITNVRFQLNVLSVDIILYQFKTHIEWQYCGIKGRHKRFFITRNSKSH